jgi:hypothetical protein
MYRTEFDSLLEHQIMKLYSYKMSNGTRIWFTDISFILRMAGFKQWQKRPLVGAIPGLWMLWFKKHFKDEFDEG